MQSRQKTKRQPFPHYIPSHKVDEDLSPHTEGVFQASYRSKDKEANYQQSSKGFSLIKQTSEGKLPTQNSIFGNESADSKPLFPSISKKTPELDDQSLINADKSARRSPVKQMYQTKSRTFWETVNKDIEHMLAGTISPDFEQENKALRDLERKLDKNPPEDIITFDKFQKYMKSCKDGLDKLLIVISKGRLERGKVLRRMWNENTSAMQMCLKSELLVAASRIGAAEERAEEALKISKSREKILRDQCVNTEENSVEIENLKENYKHLEAMYAELENIKTNELSKKIKESELLELKVLNLEKLINSSKIKNAESLVLDSKNFDNAASINASKQKPDKIMDHSNKFGSVPVFSNILMIDERCDTYDLVSAIDRYVWTDPKKTHDKLTQTDILDVVDVEKEITLRPVSDEKFNDMFLRIERSDDKEDPETLPELLMPLRLESKRLSYYPVGSPRAKRAFSTHKRSFLFDEVTTEVLTPEKLSQRIATELEALNDKIFSPDGETQEERNRRKGDLFELLTLISNSFSDFCDIVKKKEDTINTERVKSMIEKAEIQMRLSDAQKVSENWQMRFNRFFQKYRNLQNILLYENFETSLKKDREEFIKRNDKTEFDGAFLQIEKEPKESIRTRQRAHTKQLTKSQLKTEFYQCRVKVHKNLEKNEETIRALKFMRKLKEMPLLPNLSLKGDEVVCKIISTIYTELLKNQKFRVRENPLYINLYQYLSNFHGNQKSIVESKMNDIVRLSLGLEKHPKIRMFLKLLSVITDHPYEHDGSDLTFYLESLMAMDDTSSTQPGIALALVQDIRTMISIKQATDYCYGILEKNAKFKNTFSINILLNFIKDFKEPDPKIKGKWIIEVDLLIEKMICEKFNYLESLYKPLFDAIKPVNERFLNSENFSFLMIALNRNSMSYLSCEKIFAVIADMMDREKDKKYLSFFNFSEFLFYDKKWKASDIEKWMRSVSGIQISNLNQLEVEWELRRVLIKHRYVQIRIYDIYHQDMIESVDNYLKNRRYLDENEAKLAWIRYRLLEEDSLERYLRDYIEKNFMPKEFLELSKFN